MNVLQAMTTGAGRLPSIWKSIIVSWFAMLLLAASMVVPLKGALSTGLGSSMITEKLADGIDIGVLTDIDSFSSIMGGLRSGMLFMVVAGLVLNAFLTGGFFDLLREEKEGSSVSAFMKGCARNFWSFILVHLVTGIILLVALLLLSLIPAGFIDMEGDQVERSVIRTGLISGIIFFVLLLPVMMLVADYARAWKAAHNHYGTFRSIGKGFGLTFRNLAPSWITMMILLIMNVIYLWIVLSVIPAMTPSSGMGVFLLFILSQAMFIIRLVLRSYRYSCITCLMEQSRSDENAPVI